MVIDACAILAVLNEEATSPEIKRALSAGSGLVMASVTLTETILVGLKRGRSADDTTTLLAPLGIVIVPVDEALAVAAAEARHHYPIRFGDAFVYALAKARGLPVLTLDAEFMKTDVKLVPLS